jgi:hypothetical protein
MDSNVLECEYKMDVSNSETHLDSTQFGREHLPFLFIGNLQIQNHVKTKVLVHNRDRSLRISHLSIFILIDGRPGESRFWRDVMACSISVQERLRGWRCRGRLFSVRPRADSRVLLTRGCMGAQQWVWRCPVAVCSHSIGDGAAMAGVAAQG